MNGGRSGPDWASSSGTETLKRCGAGVLVVEHSVDQSGDLRVGDVLNR